MLQRMRELALQVLTIRIVILIVDIFKTRLISWRKLIVFQILRSLTRSMCWMSLAKVFQIGSNENQTMNISIGSMHSSVLGVATSNSAAASIARTSSSGNWRCRSS